MLDMGIIRESKSSYASPVTNRICVDYRKLNRLTEVDPTPMPNPDEIFHKMAKSKFLTKLDLSKGYWQIPVATEDILKTVFVTPDGSYEFMKMPFGMVNNGATLVRGLRKLLGDIEEADSFIDDIIVYTETWERHLEVLTELFGRLSNAGLTVKPSKRVIGAESIDHQISADRIKGLHQDNVEKIRNARRPKTKKEVKAFLGLTGY